MSGPYRTPGFVRTGPDPRLDREALSRVLREVSPGAEIAKWAGWRLVRLHDVRDEGRSCAVLSQADSADPVVRMVYALWRGSEYVDHIVVRKPIEWLASEPSKMARAVAEAARDADADAEAYARALVCCGAVA